MEGLHAEGDAPKAGNRVRLSGIDWDLGDEDRGEATPPDLPACVEVALPAGWTPEDGFADLLSDTHGFCVGGIAAVERIDA